MAMNETESAFESVVESVKCVFHFMISSTCAMSGVTAFGLSAAFIYIGLPLIGFGTGIAAGSLAALCQGACYGGATSGLFSLCQSYATWGILYKGIVAVIVGIGFYIACIFTSCTGSYK